MLQCAKKELAREGKALGLNFVIDYYVKPDRYAKSISDYAGERFKPFNWQ